MKPSHLTTPRTLAECQFTTGYQSAEVARRDYPLLFWILLWVCAVAALAIVLETR